MKINGEHMVVSKPSLIEWKSLQVGSKDGENQRVFINFYTIRYIDLERI